MTEEDVWKGYDPNKPLPKPPSKEELDKAWINLSPPREKPPYISYAALIPLLFWSIGHLYVLYMLAGSNLMATIFPIVLVNLIFLFHYLIMLIKSIGRYRHEFR